jgi:hypothetical protein
MFVPLFIQTSINTSFRILILPKSLRYSSPAFEEKELKELKVSICPVGGTFLGSCSWSQSCRMGNAPSP